MTIKKENIGIRVSSKFKQKLEKLATYNKRKLSDYIRIELEKIVENAEKEGILSLKKEFEDN